MNSIEFYNFEEQVMIVENGEHRPLTEQEKDILSFMDSRIQSEYPAAYKRLQELTKTSQHLPNYRRFRRVLRFCKCNFGVLDPTEQDIDHRHRFRVEVVSCPLRGICQEENIICKPRLNTRFTAREKQIVDLLNKRYYRADIAITLGISTNTVRNHIQSICAKVSVGSEAHLLQFITENRLNL